MSRLCGTKDQLQPTRKEFISDSHFFRVTFRSNDIYDGLGFSAIYQFRKVEGLCLSDYSLRTEVCLYGYTTVKWTKN